MIDPVGGARARLLHRAGVRGGADLRGGRRGRPAAAVRLGGGRRALRRPGAGASPARRCRRPASRSASTGCWRRSARRGGWPSVEAGPVVVTVMDRDRMAGYQAMAAELRAGGAAGGGVPRRRRHGAAAQVRRPARRGGGGDRGRRRARRAAWCSSRTWRSGRGWRPRSRRTRTGRRSRRRSRCRAPGWSRRCGRCWRAAAAGRWSRTGPT